MTRFNQSLVFDIAELPDAPAPSPDAPPVMHGSYFAGIQSATKARDAADRWNRRIGWAVLAVWAAVVFFGGVFVGMFWTACRMGGV